MKGERGSGLNLSEGDAWNIATYKLVPDLCRDPFVVGYHVPLPVGQWRGQDRGKRQEVPTIYNSNVMIPSFLSLLYMLSTHILPSWLFEPC